MVRSEIERTHGGRFSTDEEVRVVVVRMADGRAKEVEGVRLLCLHQSEVVLRCAGRKCNFMVEYISIRLLVFPGEYVSGEFYLILLFWFYFWFLCYTIVVGYVAVRMMMVVNCFVHVQKLCFFCWVSIEFSVVIHLKNEWYNFVVYVRFVGRLMLIDVRRENWVFQILTNIEVWKVNCFMFVKQRNKFKLWWWNVLLLLEVNVNGDVIWKFKLCWM